MDYYFILTNGSCFKIRKYLPALRFLEKNRLNVVKTNFVYI